MPRRRPHVLIVDDDYATRTMLGYLFHDEGYEVSEAADGPHALELLRAAPPDCLVLDLTLPTVDGIDVLRRRAAGKLAPYTRVLVLTARSDPQDAVWCWELGADEFVNKPVDPERLLREVRLLLGRTHFELRIRREVALEDARHRDALEAAFTPHRSPR